MIPDEASASRLKLWDYSSTTPKPNHRQDGFTPLQASEGVRPYALETLGYFDRGEILERPLRRCVSWIRRRFDCIRPRGSTLYQSAGMAQRVNHKSMEILSPLAGKPAPRELLVDVTQLERVYFDTSPEVLT